MLNVTLPGTFTLALIFARILFTGGVAKENESIPATKPDMTEISEEVTPEP